MSQIPDRDSVLARFRKMINEGVPIIGGGAGTGLSGKVRGGRRYRPYRHLQFGAFPDGRSGVSRRTSRLRRRQCHRRRDGGRGATGCHTHAGARRRQRHGSVQGHECVLDELQRLGFSGVQNFPTVGLIDGNFRANLEETGMSYALEVEMIKKASTKGMLTTPYVFSEADAKAMAEAGADIVVCHLGLTTGGSIGADTALTLG